MPARAHVPVRSCLLTLGASLVALAVVVSFDAGQAVAAQAPVDLGTATSFAVLGGTTVTNTGPSVINGDLGVSPGTAITGIKPPSSEPGLVNGTVYRASDSDGVANQAQSDESTAYTSAAGRSPVTNVPTELGGQTLVGGVYVSGTLGLTGTLTLNGSASTVWVFKASTTLITATASNIVLTGGATACNVFWQVGSSATLGTNSAFVGTILASASITADTGATVQGRLLAQNGAVTLDTNTITASTCDVTPPTSTPPTSSSPSSTGPTSTGPTSTGPSGSGSPTGGGGNSGTDTGTPAVPTGSAATSTAAHKGARSSGPGAHGHSTAGGGSGTSPGTGTGTEGLTTTLSSTGSNLSGPIGYGLLAIVAGGGLLMAVRVRRAPARHRR